MSSAKRLIDAERDLMMMALSKMEQRISKRFDEIEGRIARLETAATVTPRYVFGEEHVKKLVEMINARRTPKTGCD